MRWAMTWASSIASSRGRSHPDDAMMSTSASVSFQAPRATASCSSRYADEMSFRKMWECRRAAALVLESTFSISLGAMGLALSMK